MKSPFGEGINFARMDKEMTERRLEGAFSKKNLILEQAAIKPDDFIEPYGKENVEKDKATVRNLKARFGQGLSQEEQRDIKSTERAARVFEAIVYEQAELSNWFGENARTIKTSEFDDIVNGVDLVVEVNEPGRLPGQVALAADVSFGPSSIEKKIQRIVNEINEDSSGTLKYFFSELTGFKGQLLRVPRVVIGIERKAVFDLVGLDMNKKFKELASHPVQRVIADEVCKELEIFGKFARSKGKQNAADTYERAFQLMQRTLGEKRRIPVGDLEKDKVFERILWQIEHLR